jgi:hypothetical protein
MSRQQARKAQIGRPADVQQPAVDAQSETLTDQHRSPNFDYTRFNEAICEMTREEEAKATASWEDFAAYCVKRRDDLDAACLFPHEEEYQYRTNVADLWDLARKMGGPTNWPPPMPQVRTLQAAQAAIDTLIQWVNAHPSSIKPAPEAALGERTASGKQASKAVADVSHSDDFRCLRWCKAEYTFTPTQAACVRVLYEAWQNGSPVMGQAAILEAAESSGGRLRDVFDKGKHPAWGKLIVSPRKGAYRLSDPS